MQWSFSLNLEFQKFIKNKETFLEGATGITISASVIVM